MTEFVATPNNPTVIHPNKETLIRLIKVAGTETLTIQGQVSTIHPSWTNLTANSDGTYSVQGFLAIQISVVGGVAIAGTLS